ncbi:MAG TPA: hypothetical protein VGQ53_18785 [Chitinophagaceae bacterium]|jgi:hypothetical protein|nr:hypothetical protein [Chitinophagaceae bacterium]
MEIHLKIIGVLLILLSAIHLFFPGYFNWKEELKPLSLINRQMMQIHAFFIALVVFGIGVLCLFFSRDLVHSRFGKNICLGLAIFWVIRLFFQLFIYSPKLWRGKRKETIIHIFFTCLWTYLSMVFFFIFWIIIG